MMTAMKMAVTRRTSAIPRTATVLLLATLSVSQQAWAWGETGHRVVNNTAVDLMDEPLKEFFTTNRQTLEDFAITPDKLWKQGKTRFAEAPLHYFHWDNYEATEAGGKMPMLISKVIKLLGYPFVRSKGAAVWRSNDLYRLLVEALKNKDWPLALQMAGPLGHYIGDLAQPMHNNSDYDGQSIKRPGVHSYYEGRIVDMTSRAELDTVTAKEGSLEMGTILGSKAEKELRIIDIAINEGKTSMEDLDDVLKQFGPDNTQNVDGLKVLGYKHMGRGAANLAHIWDAASKEARINEKTVFPKEPIKVAEPEWVPLDLENLAPGLTRGEEAPAPLL